MLNTYNHHYTETHFIYSLFVSISRSWSICVISMWSIFFIFRLIFIAIYHISSFKQMRLFLHIFCISYDFWMITWMTKVVNFQIHSKSSASVCCLAFGSFFANFSLALLIKVLLRSGGLKLYWKETPTLVFSCEISEIFQNTFSYGTLPVTASDYLNVGKPLRLNTLHYKLDFATNVFLWKLCFTTILSTRLYN